MTMTILPEQMEVYRQTARRREDIQKQAMQQRREAAWRIAHQAAQLLREHFNAKRVVAFGSLAHAAWFSSRSDIDLMAEGISPEVFWRAWCALDQLSGDFEIDLVAGEEVTGLFREVIEREGVEL